MDVVPEFPSAADTSPTEIAGLTIRRKRPFTQAKPRARYFALCPATHLPPTWMQTTRPRMRSETPFVQARVTCLTPAVSARYPVAAGADAVSTAAASNSG